MVNKRFSNSWSIKYRIMKIAALFLILGINASLASSTYSQSATLSLKANNKTVQEIFSEIEKQSEYVFFYYDGILDVNRKVKLDITDQTVDIILNQLFTGTDNTYVIKDRQIFISKKKNTGLIGPLPLKAQDRSSFRGKVLDDLGEPLPGAAILVAGSTRGVTTDLDGSFELEVNKSDKLVISYLGMEDQEIVIGNQNDVVIRMKPKADELEEVTVVAYGKQKKASVIGAISTITSEQLQVPVAKLSTSLAGQMAGIVAIQRTGEPGAGADFWIRGISSFGANNTPLILVDGIERSMDLVDPEDIATFSILKDATATALYGVRGANGIVLITTKRGREAKPAINARVEYGISNPTVTPKMANASQWMDYYNDITLQGNGQLAYQPVEYDKHVNHTDPDLYPNVDWWDTTFRNISNNIRANVNVSGGGKSVRYYVAGSFYSENGIFKPVKNPQYDPQVGYKKINFRANVDINVTRLTELSLSLSNQYEIKNRLGVAMESVYNNTLAVPSVAVVPVFSDGSLSRPIVGTNPYLDLNYTGYSADFWNNAQSLISLTQDFSFITPGLKGNAKFSWDARNESTLDKRKSPVTYDALGRDKEGNLILHQNRDGNDFLSLARSNRGAQTWNFETSLTYDQVFNDDHRVNGLFLFNIREYTNNFPTDYIAAFANRNIGIAGRAAYSFRDKYFAEFNFGYNGSENFAPGKRFGFFPSGALGYMISNEDFWKPLSSVISLLKIKGSYGEIGNDKIGGDRRFAYNTEMQYTGGWNFGRDQAKWIGGIATGHPGNPNVSWETAKKTDVGFELGLFHRIKLSADYFKEKREGIYIQQQSIPSVVGINVTQYVNLGKMQNQGIDMTLEYEQQVNDELYISGRGNFTFNRNKVLYDDKPSQQWPYLNDVGFPMNQHRGLVAIGLFESEKDIANSPTQTFGPVRPGDIKYKDLNGDGKIDSNDQMEDVGNPSVPEIVYGFGLNAEWKGAYVGIFFQGSGNTSTVLGASSNGAFFPFQWGVEESAVRSEVANRWTEQNPSQNVMFPRMHSTNYDNNTAASTWWLRNASFLRLKNIEVGYNFKEKTLKKIGIQALRVYLQGNNLCVWDDIKMWDPELGNTNGGFSYPLSRTFTFGLDFTF